MKANKEIIRKYYKYKITERSLPTFSSQAEAISGVDGVSISPYYIWSSVVTSLKTPVPNSAGAYYEFYFKDGAMITSLTYRGYVTADAVPCATYRGLDAYDEANGEWISLDTSVITTTSKTIDINSAEFYKKYRIKLTGSEVSRYANMGVYTIDMSGVFRTLQESDETDYDVIEDVDVYSLPKQGIKYYGIGG